MLSDISWHCIALSECPRDTRLVLNADHWDREFETGKFTATYTSMRQRTDPRGIL